MSSYPKTENLYTRNPDTHKLNMGDFRVPEYAQIGKWLVTEKIDGTNIRLELENGVASVRGRTNAATLPKNFIPEALENGKLSTPLEGILDVLIPDREDDLWDVTVYGEGYGAGIQSGVKYSATKQLRIFDVVTYRVAERWVANPEDERSYQVLGRGAPFWRPWSDVEKVADRLGLKTAPVISRNATLRDVESFVISEQLSGVAHQETGEILIAEGVIARTDPYLFTWDRHRVMFKLKAHDIPRS